ncbi:MAG TPA: response regulator transcription factor [Candidatus Amulumruptor caecigallinarius]|uniref:Response regulator transcription factor n=1 Tax=Candidatus Amulumruptor caecigallinarius TaxID=2109911 RepID=A0A921EBW8_9BACT|nr:response regulator transcription factor [Candidatus Amulumruptor caecigallinarius]
MIRLLLVDDDVANSEFLIEYLRMEGFDVLYAKDGNQGWNLYRQKAPHLMLLDVNMPGYNGFELARKVRAVDDKVIIFFLTDRVGKEDRLTGFNIKGNDYIPKPFYPEELVAKIRERFGSDGDYELYNIGETVFDPNLSSVTFRSKSTVITQRQSEILRLLADSIGRMVPRELILNKVWGDDCYSNSLALNVQITHLRNILAADNSLQILSLRKRGYVLDVVK